MYYEKDVVILATKEKETLRNTFLYLIPKKEFVICSYFEVLENKRVVWDWGHYYFKEEFKEAFEFFYNNK